LDIVAERIHGITTRWRVKDQKDALAAEQ